MILVNKGVIDVVAGYERIIQAEAELMRRWRDPLLEAYVRRRELYEAELADFRQRTADLLARARQGMWLSSLLVILGILAFPATLLISQLGDLRGPVFCFGPFMILGGLTGWAFAGIFLLWLRNRARPAPPEHPLKSGLIEPLLPKWRDGLRGRLPSEKADEGATGEYRLILRLQNLDQSSYLLYRLRQQRNDDVDVTLVGPRGVWVFEVKYLNGTIRWRDGVWSHSKTYHAAGGTPVSEEKDIGEAYDQQWRRMRDDVADTIRRRAPGLVARVPTAARVRGGLVFTHPKATYDIPPGPPFNWGVIPFWLDTLGKEPEVPGMDELAVMEVLEVLLARHRRVTGETAQRSMATYAAKLVDQAEARLKAWVEEL